MTTHRKSHGEDLTRNYLDEIGRIPLLTPEQEQEHSLHIQVRDHVKSLRKNSSKPRDSNATRTVLRRIAAHQPIIAGLLRQAGLDDNPPLSQLLRQEPFRRLVDRAPAAATIKTVQSCSSYAKRAKVTDTIRTISLDTRCITPPAVHIMADCRLSDLHRAAHDTELPHRLSQARSHLTRHLDELCREGDRRERALTEANLRLVVSIARGYVAHNVPFLDLIQEGNIGLMRSVERFDHRKGYRFSTYSTWYIRQGIFECISEYTRQIHLPDYQAANIRRLREAQNTLTQELRRPPTIEELALHLERPVHEIRETMRLALEPAELDAPVGEEADATLAHFIPDPSPGVDEIVDRRDLTQQVREAIASLDEEQQSVIRLRYGIGDDTPHSLTEIKRRTGISPRRAHQIEMEALRQLGKQPELIGFIEAISP